MKTWCAGAVNPHSYADICDLHKTNEKNKNIYVNQSPLNGISGKCNLVCILFKRAFAARRSDKALGDAHGVGCRFLIQSEKIIAAAYFRLHRMPPRPAAQIGVIVVKVLGDRTHEGCYPALAPERPFNGRNDFSPHKIRIAEKSERDEIIAQ